MKYAIGILTAHPVNEVDYVQRAVINGESWCIRNPDRIPENAGPELLFMYNPEAQFATYVPIEQIEKAMGMYDELVYTLGKLTKVCEQPDIYPNVRGHVALARSVLRKASYA